MEGGKAEVSQLLKQGLRLHNSNCSVKKVEAIHALESEEFLIVVAIGWRRGFHALVVCAMSWSGR